MNRDDLLAALTHDNVAAFLAVIREGESSHGIEAYSVMFGGGHFDSFADHPRKKNTAILGGKPITSTAAGAYQFLAGTWDDINALYKFPDFSPVNQDCGAVALIARRKALDDVLAGRIEEALTKCSREWASLPGSPYGQPTLSKTRALAVYADHGGRLGNDPTPTKEKPVPVPLIPIFAALLPEILKLIPALATVFKPESEVAQRNVAAATIVANTLSAATSSPNLQAAVEAMQNDPQALADAKAAITDALPSLMEVGGGIVEARKAAFNPDQVPPWKNPAIWIALLILPLVYMVAVAVLFGIGGQTWSDDIKTLLITAIVTGSLGSVTGFFLGSSMGSQRKDAMLGRSQ